MKSAIKDDIILICSFIVWDLNHTAFLFVDYNVLLVKHLACPSVDDHATLIQY